jgi:hypothetical protein
MIACSSACNVCALFLQVVLLWNMDVPGGLANGTRGMVERMASVREYLQQVTTGTVKCSYCAVVAGSASLATKAVAQCYVLHVWSVDCKFVQLASKKEYRAVGPTHGSK